MRFTSTLALVSAAALLASCGSPPSSPGGGSVQQATVAGAIPARPAMTGPARSWDEYKLRVARRVMETSGGETFSGPLPDPLQSIPVLQVQLHRDGSIRRIEVLRTPRQSPQTLEMATRAIRRAGPFEPVGHLPQPWQFSETFLYNDDLKFQLRTLVEAP